MVTDQLLKTTYNTAHIDRSMLPYFCDGNGVHLQRAQLATPDIAPHVLVRIEVPTRHAQWRHSTTYAAIVCPDGTIKIVNGNGRSINTVHVDILEIIEYLENNAPSFLNTIVVTCANCRSAIGPPGIIDRSGKRHYRHILCASCAPTAAVPNSL